MNRDEFEEGLRELDAGFERDGLPAAADARLRTRLESGPRRSASPWLWAGAAAVATAVLVVLAVTAPSTLGGLTVVERGAQFEALVSAEGVVRVARGTATLSDPREQAALRLEAGSEVARLDGGARVHRGVVRFEVLHLEHRAASYAVHVSGGVIEVLGTSFTVVQGESAGQVSLERGSIRFVAGDGRTVLLEPGGSISWPLAAPEPEPVPPATSPSPSPRVRTREPDPEPVIPPSAGSLAVEPAPVFSSDQVLAQVASLRSRGSFEEAVVVLTRALEESPAGVTQERLGFELGSILSHQLHDGPRACAFWTSYQQQHVGGRYAREVSAARQELGCE